ncbi:hypothetical protein B0H14DRAFT_3640656 [Mycena olivaceomarginata]|nr:hypothetical protein B0H14DRAFT_3640656 [Mycena olivaceomarginata]
MIRRSGGHTKTRRHFNVRVDNMAIRNRIRRRWQIWRPEFGYGCIGGDACNGDGRAEDDVDEDRHHKCEARRAWRGQLKCGHGREVVQAVGQTTQRAHARADCIREQSAGPGNQSYGAMISPFCYKRCPTSDDEDETTREIYWAWAWQRFHGLKELPGKMQNVLEGCQRVGEKQMGFWAKQRDGSDSSFTHGGHEIKYVGVGAHQERQRAQRLVVPIPGREVVVALGLSLERGRGCN